MLIRQRAKTLVPTHTHRQPQDSAKGAQSSSIMMMIRTPGGSSKRLDTKMGRPTTSADQMRLLVCVLWLLVSVNMVESYIKRTQYHEQGLHGPKSYKFGYTSGDHKNPQERHEVSDGHGHVKGWYSFMDGAGKHQVVHYEAHPKYGFKVYDHKVKAYNNGKRHYNS